MYDDYDNDYDCDFANPGSGSALRRASKSNPRIFPCPNCGEENVLTRADVLRGYQCDSASVLAELRCADRAEGKYC